MKTYTLYIPQRYDSHEYGFSVPVPLEQVTRQLGELVLGFTITEGRGYWKGKDKLYVEPVYVVEIVTDFHLDPHLVLLLDAWKEQWDQEAMFYQVRESQGVLL